MSGQMPLPAAFQDQGELRIKINGSFTAYRSIPAKISRSLSHVLEKFCDLRKYTAVVLEHVLVLGEHVYTELDRMTGQTHAVLILICPNVLGIRHFQMCWERAIFTSRSIFTVRVNIGKTVNIQPCQGITPRRSPNVLVRNAVSHRRHVRNTFV